MIGSHHIYFHEELIRRVTADKIEKALQLSQGYAQDYPDYRYACGVLAGLDLALDIAEEIKKAIEAA